MNNDTDETKSGVNFLQLNLHKSEKCNAELNKWMIDNEDSVALCQEPAHKKGKLISIDNSRIKTYTGVPVGKNQIPRAAILINSNLITALKLTQFSNMDQVAILTDDLKNPGKKIVLTSTYMPFDSVDSPPPLITQELVIFCEQKGYSLIIGTDCNSHNRYWGSTNNNERGEDLLEFIVSTNMEVCNIGNQPTFVVANRSEVLDITLASIDLFSRIREWKVLDKDMLSDHRPISFELSTTLKKVSKYRNVRKTDWDKYHERLAEELDYIDAQGNLDTQAQQLNTAIISAYHDSCIPRKKKCNKDIPWWNNDLAELKRDYKRKRAAYHRDRTDENRIARNRADALYKRSMKEAKRQSWRNFCEKLDKLPAIARMHRLMKNGGMANIGTLQRADKSFTTDATETLTELMDTLIPSRDPNLPQYSVENFLTDNNLNMDEEVLDRIVNTTTIIAAVKQFQPVKSPGADGIYPILLQKGILLLAHHLERIYKMSLTSGRIADPWKIVKTVFIPKPGKDDYNTAKSFRPISLMSFILKTLERLLFWYINDIHMVVM